MFANQYIAVLSEVHRFIMVIEVLSLCLVFYILFVLLLRSLSWSDTVVLWSSRNISLEMSWTIIPACIVVSLINICILSVYILTDPVYVSFSFDVIGFQWYWNINRSDMCMVASDYLEVGGLRLLETSNWLVLPVDTFVRAYISAFDVIHSFAVPQLGVKMDAVPGRLNHVSIISHIPGFFYGQCSELCGSLHGFMPIKIEFV